MSLFPFSVTSNKDYQLKRRMPDASTAMKYEQVLADYRDTLESYKAGILRYSKNLDEYDKTSSVSHNRPIQTRDDKINEKLENLLAGIVETNYKLEGLDRSIIKHLSDDIVSLQNQVIYENNQNKADFQINNEKLLKSVKRQKKFLWILLFFQLIGISALAFIILYMLEIIPF